MRNRHVEPRSCTNQHGGSLYLPTVRARDYDDPHRGPIPQDVPDWCRGGDDPIDDVGAIVEGVK